jgi:hypothetical protein
MWKARAEILGWRSAPSGSLPISRARPPEPLTFSNSLVRVAAGQRLATWAFYALPKRRLTLDRYVSLDVCVRTTGRNSFGGAKRVRQEVTVRSKQGIGAVSIRQKFHLTSICI